MNTRSDDNESVRSRANAAECDVRLIDEAAVERVRGAVGAGEGYARAASVFGALADPTRLLLLRSLMVEPLCVCDLAAVVGVSQSGVSHQLRSLRELGFVTFQREGKRAIYSIADGEVRLLLERLVERVGARTVPGEGEVDRG